VRDSSITANKLLEGSESSEVVEFEDLSNLLQVLILDNIGSG
jgi:hypothetical protein